MRGGMDYEYSVPGRFCVVRCADCRLWYLNPRPTEDELPSLYPPTYHAFEKPAGRLFQALSRLQWDHRVRFYRTFVPGPAHVLDVGCGDGEAMEQISRRTGWTMAGLDINPKACQAARTRGFTVHQGSLETSDFAPGSFDLVLMHHVLEHVPDPLQSLKILSRLLRKGGWLVGQLPNAESLECRVFSRYWNGYHFPRHLQFFTPRTLEALLASGGFEHAACSAVFHPGQWALSIQSFIVGTLALRPPLRSGKAWFYPLCLMAALMPSLL